jgi:sphinganine C4-monooxygenase
LGYLTAAEKQPLSHEYAIAVWVQNVRYGGIVATQWLRYLGLELAWVANNSKGSGSGFVERFIQNTYGNNIRNLSQVAQPQTAMVLTDFSAWTIITAKILYWILVPLFQYISVMILADTMQYFTHRAFHVNKWLYSKLLYNHSTCSLADTL